MRAAQPNYLADQRSPIARATDRREGMPTARQDARIHRALLSTTRLFPKIALDSNHQLCIGRPRTDNLHCLPDQASSGPFSLAITPLKLSRATSPPSKKQVWNGAVSSKDSTRLNVSCEGIPSGNPRNVRNHASLALPNTSISVECSAPQIATFNAMTRTSMSLCRRVRSTYESTNILLR